jgi:hypothetical protein
VIHDALFCLNAARRQALIAYIEVALVVINQRFHYAVVAFEENYN